MAGSDLNSTRRFSDRVENYVKYRPSYPDAVVTILEEETGLAAGDTVADIGSGTGISTGLFLRHGNVVFAVEPNAEMRAAAEALLGDHPDFHSIDGTAEATGLPDGSIDLVTAGQAFHWFAWEPTRREFERILVPNGFVALFWNARRLDSTSFLRDYEALLREHGTDYEQVNHTGFDRDRLRSFFGGSGPEVRSAHNEQRLDYAALEGRLLSSSYAPAEGHPGHPPMIAALRDLFARHNQDGQVVIDYDTTVFFGRLA